MYDPSSTNELWLIYWYCQETTRGVTRCITRIYITHLASKARRRVWIPTPTSNVPTLSTWKKNICCNPWIEHLVPKLPCMHNTLWKCHRWWPREYVIVEGLVECRGSLRILFVFERRMLRDIVREGRNAGTAGRGARDTHWLLSRRKSNMFRAAVMTSTAIRYEKVGVFIRWRLYIYILYSTNYYYYHNNNTSSSSSNKILLCCNVRFPVISSPVGSRYNSSSTCELWLRNININTMAHGPHDSDNMRHAHHLSRVPGSL